MTPTDRIVAAWAAAPRPAPFRILPDGCRDLVVCVPASGPPRVVLTGLDRGPRLVRGGGDVAFIGVRLRPGSTVSGLEAAAGPLPRDLEPSQLQEPLAGWLRAVARDPGRAEDLLREAVDRWIVPPDPATRDLLAALAQGGTDRRAVAAIRARSFRRRISGRAGAPPSFWLQLRRARTAGLRLVSTTDAIAAIAFDAGYADQPHLTREIRRWFGVTPARLRARAAEYRSLLQAPDAFSAGGTK